MSRTLWLRWAFALSGLIAIISGALIVYRWPTTLTIAVGPENSPLLAYTREIRDALATARAPYRLKIVATQGSPYSSKVLDSRKADLAIVRSDDETSQFARSLVVLQRKTLFAIARKQALPSTDKPAAKPAPPKQVTAQTADENDNTAEGKAAAAPKKPAPAAKKQAKLSRKKPTAKTAKGDGEDDGKSFLEQVGKMRGAILNRRGSNDLPIVRLALQHYGINGRSGSLPILNRKEAEAAFRARTIDFLIVFAHPSELAIRRLVRTSRGILGNDFTLLGPPGAKGLAYQLKNLENSSLPAGVFGGNPPLPASDLESVAVTYEMVATTHMGERRAANLTKTLTDLRTQLRGSDDGEFAIELPSTDEVRRYLPHPGSMAISNGEVKTILDAYSDIIWLALFGLGLAGSAISSLMTWLGIGRKKGLDVS